MKRILPASVAVLIVLASLQAGGTAPRKEDVPKYVQMLKTATKPADRALAADMLGRRGAINLKDVEEAIEPLKKALKADADASVRRSAALAIGMIAPEPASDNVPLLIDALSDKEFTVRLAVAQAVSAYGPAAKDALPALRSLQKDAKEMEKKDAMKTINMAIQTITGKGK